MFRCYSLHALKPQEGIDPSEFECILGDSADSRMMFADIRMVPVLEYAEEMVPAERAQLSLAFIQDRTDDPDTLQPGSVVSVNPKMWQICTDRSDLLLLDPCGPKGTVLLFLPPDRQNVLTCPDPRARDAYVAGTDGDGCPVLSRPRRGYLMLSALGYRMDSFSSPAEGQGYPLPCSTTSTGTWNSPRREAQEGQEG